MKLFSLPSNLSSSVLACSIALGVLAPGARAVAQNSNLNLIANVPFAFRSGSTLMPAGKYQITKLSNQCLLIRASDQTRSQMLMALNAQTLKESDHSKLIFHRYGSQYFLYQIWTSGSADGFEFPKGHAEKEMLRAQNKPVPSTSELALNEKP